MLAKTGTKADLYAEYSRLQEAIERSEPEINRLASVSASLEAEIEEDDAADWYLVHTFPGEDIKAMRYLARRRFGVFRPMQQRGTGRNDGRVTQGWEAVFPGWLFVFCWNVRKMRSRICSSPGVIGILSDPVSQRPVPVDVVDRNGRSFIDKLRELSWVYKENAPHATHYSVQSKSAISKISMQQRKALKKLKKRVKEAGLWDQSTWEQANLLAPHERIALLQRAVNAPSLGTS